MTHEPTPQTPATARATRQPPRRRHCTPRIAAILPVLLTLTGFLLPADAPAGSARTVENSGNVCFERGERPGDPRVGGTLVTFRPHLGCLSSSCTEVLESRFTLDAGPGRIAMTSRFTVRQRPGMQVCTADCMGGGRAEKYLTDLGDGRYRLSLGGTDIGTLDTDELDRAPDRRICFNTERPDDPTRKPAPEK